MFYRSLPLIASLICIFSNPTSAGESEPSVEWITLGTSGGPGLVADRAQIANALVVDGAVYLFDVGNGTRRQLVRSGLSITDVQAVFVSHHHIDHVAELGQILIARWLRDLGEKTMPVYGPDGTGTLVGGLVEAYAPTVNASYTVLDRKPLPLLSETAQTHDIPVINEPEQIFQDANIRVSAITVDHFLIPPNIELEKLPSGLAFRVEAGGRSYVFTGDTGVSANLEKLSKDADVLITEVVDPNAIAVSVHRRDGSSESVDSLVTSITTNHLSPDQIGEIAARAGVKKVVLTHYVGFTASSDISGLCSRYDGPVVLANDLDRF